MEPTKLHPSLNLTNFWIDSHCHLNYSDLCTRLDEVVQNANKSGIGMLHTICTNLHEINDILKIVNDFSNIYCSIGVHPLNILESLATLEHLITLKNNNDTKNQIIIEKLREDFTHFSKHIPDNINIPRNDLNNINKLSEYLLYIISINPKIISIGETGLDYFKAIGEADKEMQRLCFEQHIVASKKSGLPLVIHTRDAEDDTIAILEQYANYPTLLQKKSFLNTNKYHIDGVLHCFTGSAKLAKAAISLGLYISASGIITFKNAQSLRDIFKEVPLDRILIETDAPFLAPVPYRGQSNEPAYLIETAKILADIKNINLEELKKATSHNFVKLFKLGK